MPKPDYSHQVSVLVGCSGPSETPAAETGPAGAFASKASAHLEYAVADVESWQRQMGGPSPVGEDCLREAMLLREATRGDVLGAVAEASSELNAHKGHSRGGSLNLCYSGHGLPNGDLCLADGPLSPDDLADAVTEGFAGGESRHLRVVLDSCYSGMTLGRLYVHRGHGTAAYVLRDAFAACLPSEEAFELPRFGHGVLTYVRTRPSPLHIINRARAAGREPTVEELRQAQKTNRETVHYLTNGRQHALDMINGHAVSVMDRPRSGIELAYHDWSLDELVEAFEAIGTGTRRRPRPKPGADP